MKIKDLKKIIENIDDEVEVVLEDDNGTIWDCFAEKGWYVLDTNIKEKITCLTISKE